MENSKLKTINIRGKKNLKHCLEFKIVKIYKFELNFQNAYVWKAYIWKDKFLRPKNITFIKVYFRDTYSGTPCNIDIRDLYRGGELSSL